MNTHDLPVRSLADAHLNGLEIVRRHTERFLTLAASLDSGQQHLRIANSDWDAAQTVVHVQSVFLRYTVDLRRATDPADVARLNADDLDRLGRDVGSAIGSIREQLNVLTAVIPHVAPEQTFPFHAGQATTTAGGLGNLLGELLAHGDDVARATNTRWTVTPAHLELLWRHSAPLLQGWLRPHSGNAATFRLDFPFGSFDASIDQLTLRWGEPVVAEPDHHIVVDDVVTATLAFPYRRRTITDPTLSTLADRFFPI